MRKGIRDLLDKWIRLNEGAYNSIITLNVVNNILGSGAVVLKQENMFAGWTSFYFVC